MDFSGNFTLFQNFEEYKRFHENAVKLPAVLANCNTGGRLLHWMPYKSKFREGEGHYVKSDFTHIYTKEVIFMPLIPQIPT